MTRFKTISADSHVIEPPDLWVDYIDPEFKERAPHVVRENGNDVFKCEEVSLIQVGSVSGAGKASADLNNQGTFETTMPGAWDPTPRLKEIAPDGVEAEVLYPSIALRMFGIKDVEYQFACFRAYNSWMSDFCKQYPDRFKGVALIPVQDLKGVMSEMDRAKEIGLSGIAIALYPGDGRQYDDPAFDPMWQAAQDLDLPVSLHVLTERRPQVGLDPLTALTAQTVQLDIQQTLARMILSGVFRRFPHLKVVSVENDAGWAGYFVDRIDYLFERRRYHETLLPRDKRPSEYFRKGVFLTFMRDRAGILVREVVGVDNIMWSSDYPHLDSTYPNSQKMIDDLCRGVPADERHKIVAGNVAKLYGFD